MENCRTIDEIAHPAVRETLRYLNLDFGLEIHHDADLPARSGMGSSSSFTVGLLHALYGLKGYMPTKQQLAAESIYIEQDRVRETVGSQDQLLAAFGGFNHITFLPTGHHLVRPLPLSSQRVEELNSRLMLFYTGVRRTASVVAQSYAHGTNGKEQQMAFMSDLVTEGIAVLSGGQDITRFGKLLHEAWQAKRSFSSHVSSPFIEDIYEGALSAGAIGGKLLGAGAGGFMLLFVHPSDQVKVRERLHTLIHVPFKFEFSGSQIIFFDPEEDYTAAEQDRARRNIASFREADGLALTPGDAMTLMTVGGGG
jgi:D-glycero-alpha-D-manno-heptose-7-phosphate kinase